MSLPLIVYSSSSYIIAFTDLLIGKKLYLIYSGNHSQVNGADYCSAASSRPAHQPKHCCTTRTLSYNLCRGEFLAALFIPSWLWCYRFFIWLQSLTKPLMAATHSTATSLAWLNWDDSDCSLFVFTLCMVTVEGCVNKQLVCISG